jgi:hypothetical protein
MDFNSIIRVLWLRRLSVGVGLAVAVFVGLLVSYKVQFTLPPKIESRRYSIGLASRNILIDTASSQVADLKPNGAEQLNGRASLFANLIATPPIQAIIAKRTGIRVDQLVTTAPSMVAPLVPRPLSANSPRASSAADEYRLTIDTQEDLPIIVINAEAPDGASAARLADGTFYALREYLADAQTQQRIPRDRRPVISPLGRAASAEVIRGPRRLYALLAALMVLGLACAAIVGASRIACGWRDAAEYERRRGRGGPSVSVVADTGTGTASDAEAPPAFDDPDRSSSFARSESAVLPSAHS